MTGSVFFGARLAACKKSAPEPNGGGLAEIGGTAIQRGLQSVSDSRIKCCMWTEWGQNEDNSAPITRSQIPILQSIRTGPARILQAILQELQVGP